MRVGRVTDERNGRRRHRSLPAWLIKLNGCPVIQRRSRFVRLLGKDKEDLPLVRTLAAATNLITRPEFP